MLVFGRERFSIHSTLNVSDFEHFVKDKTDQTKQYWHEEPILMKSPLSRNKHPVSQWAEEEELIKQKSVDKAISDAPIQECDVS